MWYPGRLILLKSLAIHLVMRPKNYWLILIGYYLYRDSTNVHQNYEIFLKN